MATNRFLNAEYGGHPRRINITDMEDLCEVRDEVKEKYEFNQGSASVQLWMKSATGCTLIEDLDEIPDEYYLEPKYGGLSLTIVLPISSRELGNISGMSNLITAEYIDAYACKRQRNEISDLTTLLQSFADAQLVNKCLQATNDDFLPFPQSEIKKIYVRKCYEDVFDLLIKNIEMESFAISGTSGIGKSLFFVYILYRLMKDFSEKTLPLKPNRIVYQRDTEYISFNLENHTAVELDPLEAHQLVRQQDTFYIIDGQMMTMFSSCVTLFISPPRSKQYKEFVKQKMAMKWYFPVWTLEEIQSCQTQCYPDLSTEILIDRYRICGGVARLIFLRNPYITVAEIIDATLADVNAVKGVRSISIPTKIYATTHTLLHIIVSNDGFYRFTHVDIASKYVGEQLWMLNFAQMIINLREMYGYYSSEMSRNLFKIYGHRVFSVGNRTLRCRCLENGSVTEITLDNLKGQRNIFGKDTIPKAEELPGRYYELTDKDKFPEIDSLSPQGMFLFIVAPEHPIRRKIILNSLSELYDEPKLYFVVPPNRFKSFQKQSFEENEGTTEAALIAKLKQYVVELEVL